MRALMIAGTHSGCGKTTLTLGLHAALASLGKKVQVFKAGPDFIDPGLQRLVSSRPAYNLDLWMMGETYVRKSFQRHAACADVVLVEGVMGLYDGRPSSADLACLLNLPVILVVDAYGQAESAGALVEGFRRYPPAQEGGGQLLAGVIFNRVGSPAHYERLQRSVTDLPVLGFLPRSETFRIPERHLGLVTAAERPLGTENLEQLARTIADHIDLAALLAIGDRQNKQEWKESRRDSEVFPGPEVTIACAQDEAFCFYYEDNLELLSQRGAKIVPFSPLTSPCLPPETKALYLGGGYPELYAARLAANKSLLAEIRKRGEAGLSILAECGGLMYLSRGLYDLAGKYHVLAGLLPFDTRMGKKLARLGYRELQLTRDCLLGPPGVRLRGHEFHYSEIIPETSLPGFPLVFSLSNREGNCCGRDGWLRGNLLASYVHVHFASRPEAADHWLAGLRAGNDP
jgi:cobyrinic acid a,c-diamide synthase